MYKELVELMSKKAPDEQPVVNDTSTESGTGRAFTTSYGEQTGKHMFNLVEVQTALQSPSVQLADLMKYANGSSAEVPAYLALGELNRRKQLEATNTAFNATPPTVKDQLTNAPPAVNPTAAPQGIAPTGAPQLASAVAAPPRMNVAAAPANQVNPIAPPQMAAEGGLLSIPTPHMFKQESYANGGIVAFDAGGKTSQKMTDSEKDAFNRMYGPGAVSDAVAPNTDAEKWQAAADAPAAKGKHFLEKDHWWTPYSAPVTKWMDEHNPIKGLPGVKSNIDALKVKKQEIDDEDAARLKRVVPLVTPVAPVADKEIQTLAPIVTRAPKVVPAAAAPVAPVAPIAPIFEEPEGGRPEMGDIIPKHQATPLLTHEQDLINQKKAYDNQQEMYKKLGISDDPHKDTRGRMDKLEAKRAAQEAEDPFNSLMARLAAYGSSKEQTFGGGMGDSAIAGAKLSKETAALRDKQATEMIAARQAMETAEDARKRGDLTALKAANKDLDTHNLKIQELDIQRGTLETAQAAQVTQAQVAQTNEDKSMAEIAKTRAETYWMPKHFEILDKQAQAQMIQALAHRFLSNKPSVFAEEVALAKANPELYKLVQSAKLGDTAAMRNAEMDKKLYGDYANNPVNWDTTGKPRLNFQQWQGQFGSGNSSAVNDAKNILKK